MPNAIVQISKFIWAVMSCGGRPNAEVFTHHYELHYQNKKIHLEGSETTFAAQFGLISFHPSRFGNRLGLLWLHGISGLVVGIATSFTARCLWNREIISRVQRLIR
jgi:hypothetical protein